jgi:hypothetical protein
MVCEYNIISVPFFVLRQGHYFVSYFKKTKNMIWVLCVFLFKNCVQTNTFWFIFID